MNKEYLTKEKIQELQPELNALNGNDIQDQEVKMPLDHSLGIRLALVLLLSVFIGEFLIMLVIQNMPHQLGWLEGPLDSLLLSLMMLPAVFFFVIRPITIQTTKRMQAEYMKNYSLLMMEEVVEYINNGILVVNEHGKVIKTNARFAEMWHIPADILTTGDDKKLLDYVLDQLADPVGFIDKVNELYENNDAESLDLILLKDGRTFERTSKPLYNSGTTKGRGWSFLDITERKNAEEALRKSEAHKYTMFQSLPDLVWLKDVNGVYVSCNKMYERLIGASEARIVGKSDFDFFDSEFAEFYRKNDRDAVAAGIPVSNEEWFTFADDGHQALFDVIRTPMYDSDGTLIGVLNIGHDITERKRAEESLHASQQLIEGIINAIPVRIFWKDSKSIYLGCNTIFARDAGFSDPKDIIGKDDFQMGWRNQAELYRSGDRQVMESGNPILLNEEPQTTPEGNTIILLTNKIPLKNSMGEIYGILGTSMNITERIEAVKEIKLKNEQLLKLNTEKDKFFSIIAHDLRSPFNSFLGLTQVMAEDLHKLSINEMQGIAATMSKSAINLYRLLENLLEWAQMQQGLIPFNPENIQLNMIVEESMEMIQESTNLKGIEISTDIPEGIEVFADLKIMQTVIRNLVSNAIKFTPKGGKVSVLAKNTKENKVEISIRDTGIGMNQTMIDNLFRLDIKTNFSGTDGEPSAGLGLLLCKEFIERHDGKISVESDIGKGSTFIFTISGTEGRLRQTQPFAN